jgi:hypothetical protein
VRYWLWWAASVKFLVPFSLLTLLGGSLAGSVVPVIEAGDWPATLGFIAEPMPEAAAWPLLALTLFGIWAVGFAAVAARWVVRAIELNALLRWSTAHKAALPRSAGGLPVRTTPLLAEPALIGRSPQPVRYAMSCPPSRRTPTSQRQQPRRWRSGATDPPWRAAKPSNAVAFAR